MIPPQNGRYKLDGVVELEELGCRELRDVVYPVALIGKALEAGR